MKRNNIILAGVLVIVFILGLVGGTLANPQAMEIAGEDRLVGVFITTEYLDLFDFDSYFNDNAKDIVNGAEIKDDGKYEGRLYANLTEEVVENRETGESHTRPTYSFEGVDGYSYFTVTMQEDGHSYSRAFGADIITGGNTKINVNDFGEDIELTGTIHVLPDNGSNVFHLNPVYQTADGKIYALGGSGISGNMDSEGTFMTQTLEASYSVTEDGVTNTNSTKVEISIGVMYRPVGIEVLEFDGNSEIVARKEYTPGEVPRDLRFSEDSEYIVVVTEKFDPQKGLVFSAETYNRADKSMDTFFAGDDGICRSQYTSLNWD